MIKEPPRKFKKASIAVARIENPERFLAIAVIHQAFADASKSGRGQGWATRRWLQFGNTLPFWRDVAEIDEDALDDAIKLQFPNSRQ